MKDFFILIDLWLIRSNIQITPELNDKYLPMI